MPRVGGGFGPKAAASSMDLSKPSKRAIKVTIAKGTQIRMCPSATVKSDSSIPMRVMRISNATPRMIPGMTSGSMIMVVTGFWPGMR